MKRLLLMLSLVVGIVSTAMATTYTASPANKGDVKNMVWTANDVAWNFALTGNQSFNFDTQVSAKGLQMGTSKTACTKAVISTSDITGAITSIKVNASMAKDGDAKLSVSVGGTEYSPVSVNLDTTAKEYTFEGNSEGEIQIVYTATKKAFYLKTITVEYNSGGDTPTPTPVAPELPVVTFGDVTADNNGEYQVVAGTEVTVTSTGAESIIVSNTTDGEQTVEGDTYNFTVDADEMYEFTGVNNVGSSDKFAVTFTVVEAPKTGGIVYTLVKSANELVAGETYTIACADKGVAMKNESKDANRPEIAVEFDGDSFVATVDVLALTLEGNPGEWSIKTSNYLGNDGYFNLGTKNQLHIENDKSYWSISIDENGNSEIKNTNANNQRIIRYNSASHIFGAYQIGQAAVQLYREEVVAPKIFINEEEVFAGHVVDLVAGDKVVIRGHEANELHYKLSEKMGGMRAPAADTEGWVKHDSSEFTYTVPEGFENMSISLAAKAVNNGKESTPLQFTVSEGTSTGINGVEAEDAAAKTEWFTIQGVRVAAPAESGLYIRRQGSKVEKVVL